ncbi:hypothetical protein M9Y10_011753 [Tritrichomonas musculus]|uniref:Myb-like DNA-binding domain containing protein n=1 Tax=Tritrichomonas musculus TaxID=1915356 RepID=A0ABR2ILK7_9EUKA
MMLYYHIHEGIEIMSLKDFREDVDPLKQQVEPIPAPEEVQDSIQPIYDIKLNGDCLFDEDVDVFISTSSIQNGQPIKENNQNKKKQWYQIATYFHNKSPQQIMNRWNKVINPSLIKANWSKEEDELIIKWVKEDGERGWTKIAAKLKGRIGKQCRERWINCLNPNIIKTKWTEKEDSIIIEMHEKLGNK